MGADILHIHAIGPALLVPYAKILGMKVVFTHHGPDYDRDKWGIMAKTILKLGERMGCMFADDVIVISDVIRNLIKNKYNRINRVHLIYNGVSKPEFCDYPEYFNELGIEKGKYILGMCRFVPEKNLHHLIEAFSKIDNQGCKLVLAGDTDFEDDYSRKLKETARKHGVILTGFIKGKKLHSLLTNCRCYCLPSSHEGLPIALLEAMSYNIPVIVSDIPANMEVGLSKDVYFHVGNIKELSEKLTTIINTPLTHPSYNMEKYDWDRISNEVIDIYKTITIISKSLNQFNIHNMLKLNTTLENKTVFVTGIAGFIGSYLALDLLKREPNIRIVGIDSITDYYDISLKEERLKNLEKYSNFTFIKGNIADKALIEKIFREYKPNIVVNLAAQAGVRYSITNPDAYVESNLIGFYNILEACRHSNPQVEHLVYASSSSVYGSNKKVPYSTDDKVDNPVSLYAATKKSNELMAHAYSKLYNIPSTGLRFFTVYGPAGRPDMAYFGFTNKLREGKTIQIFNYGHCKRDFTYIDDIVEGVIRVMQHAPEKKNGEDGLPIPPYKVYNIGNNQPENLLDFVTILQEELIRAKVLPEDYDFEAHKELVPMQPGDVPVTYADTTPLEQDFGFKPSTSLRKGLRAFAEWYASYYLKK